MTNSCEKQIKRELVEIRHDWTCSRCGYRFCTSDCIDGMPLNEIVLHLEKIREQAFAEHVCLRAQMLHNVKVFRMNLFDWWAGYDLASVKSAYLTETRVAQEEAFDQEEEVPPEAMKTLRFYPRPYAKQSSTFQVELSRMVAENHVFPCCFAGRYALP
jgi:hypothetical protein